MIDLRPEYFVAAASKPRRRNALKSKRKKIQSEPETLSQEKGAGAGCAWDTQYHLAVLPVETMAVLAPQPGEVFLDGTLGGGGHSEALLKAGARVIGIDQDPEAIAYATQRLAPYGARFEAVRGNFSEAGAVLDRLSLTGIDGALLDIGVSSWQLDAPQRGFSFQADGPLDMRMNPDAPLTAADLVNSSSAEELATLFWTLGEEPASRRIAAQIVRDRANRPLETTFDLVRSVEKVSPRRGRTHPATKVFQALRIAVNRELEALESALAAISARLLPGGRFAVITFHSLEDRIVKNFFRTRATEWLDRPEWPEPRRNPVFEFRLLTPKPVVATAAEQSMNPRARSAKLRAVQKQ